MQTYNLNIFELEVSFKTEAEPERVEKACAYAETLYGTLKLQATWAETDC